MSFSRCRPLPTMEKTVWLNSYNSELFKLRKRPAVWVVFGVWLALMLVFTYVFPYLGYRAAPGSATGRALLTNFLPQQLAGQAITVYPVWGGALIVVLGALALGSEYGWGTMRTILSLSLIHISEPTRLGMISYAVFCLKKKKK